MISQDSLDSKKIRRSLLSWYDRQARDLPWRGQKDPYGVWVSEVMLQQTQAETVRAYYLRFVNQFPTVAALAAAPERSVLQLWEGLGYYSRARHLHQAAKQICRQGRFPSTAVEWQRLPGIGRYTAGAVASIALGERAAVVDGNVKRVLARLLAETRPIENPAVIERFWQVAGDWVPARRPGDFNQAVMELGACLCTPRNPRCQACPLSRMCRAQALGKPTAYPVRKKKKPIPHYAVVAAVIRHRGRYLIQRRPDRGLLGGLWEFPGGKIEPGETPVQAVRREVREEVGIRIRVLGEWARIDHAYSHFSITLHAMDCRWTAGSIATRPEGLRWIRPDEFQDFPFPRANRKIIEGLFKTTAA